MNWEEYSAILDEAARHPANCWACNYRYLGDNGNLCGMNDRPVDDTGELPEWCPKQEGERH